MSDHYAKPYLYDQPDNVIARYEAIALERIAQSASAEGQSHFDYVQTAFDLIHAVANEVWLSEITYE